MTADFTAELQHSVQTFQKVDAERFAALQRESALLSDLPSLKALLTTKDDRTIQNASLDFWKMSGNELFGLAGPDDCVHAVDTVSRQNDPVLALDLMQALKHPGQRYLLSHDHLFRFATSRVYFGGRIEGTLLGTVISGYEIDSAYLQALHSVVGSDAAFVSQNALLDSSIPVSPGATLPQLLSAKHNAGIRQVTLNSEHFLATSNDLSSQSNVPLQVIFYRSLRPTELEIRDISRQLILLVSQRCSLDRS